MGRPVFVLVVLAKLISQIFYNIQTSTFLSAAASKAAFKTSEAAFIATIASKATSFGIPFAMAVSDVEAAFDNIRVRGVEKGLRRRNVPLLWPLRPFHFPCHRGLHVLFPFPVLP